MRTQDILRETWQKIASEGFDPDIIISMTGLDPDCKKLLDYIKQNNTQPRHLFDIAYMLNQETIISYVERNDVPEEDVYKLNRLFQWGIPGIERFLEQDIPLNHLDRFSSIMSHRSYTLEELFENLEYDNNEFKLRQNNIDENELDEDVHNLVESLNTNKNLQELIKEIRKMTVKSKEYFLDFELDDESKKLYEKILSITQFKDCKDVTLKIIALNGTFHEEGMKFCLKEGIPAEHIQNITKAYEISPEATKDLLENFDIRHFTTLFDSRHKYPKEFKESEELFEYPAAIAYHSTLNKWARKKIRSYRHRMSKRIRDDFIISCSKYGIESSEYALKHKIFNYRSRLPVIQLKEPHKILERAEEIIRTAKDLNDTAIIEDKEVQNILGNKKATVNELEDICRNHRGAIRFKAQKAKQEAKGISIKDLEKIAQQTRISPADLKKVTARIGHQGNYTIDHIKSSLNDLKNMLSRNVKPESFGLSKIVEGEFRVLPQKEMSGGFFSRTQSDNHFVLGFYPNAQVIYDLNKKGKILSEHYQDVIAYARCYIEGNKIRIEELQSDIYDKTKQIPSSLRNKYHDWPSILIKAVEHLAASTGHEQVRITTSATQIMKWTNYQGLRGVTAYDIYTKTPMKEGYRLKNIEVIKNEETGDGFIINNPGSNMQIMDVAWVKDVKKRSYNKLFYRNEEEKKTERAVSRAKVQGEATRKRDLPDYMKKNEDETNPFED